MSPNILPVFEALPVEVLANILRQTTSPEDLYATIRASPRALSTFLWYREDILIQVLQAHLPAEIFAEFLGLLHTPKYEDFNYVPDLDRYGMDPTGTIDYGSTAWEACRYDGWPAVAEDFFETHFENVRVATSSGIQRYSIPQSSDKHSINYLASVYGMLRRLIWDYQIFVRRNLIGSAPLSSIFDPDARTRNACLPRGWPPLNENETLRLQRGFLRYELCSRLSANRSLDPRLQLAHDDDFAAIPAAVVSEHIERWEEEEIRCVWTYVHAQYQVLFRDIVAEFCSDVQRLSRKARHAPDNEVILAPEIFPGRFADYHSRWAFAMSNLGLPLLQQLLQSEFEVQRSFLKNTHLEHLPSERAGLFLSGENTMRNEWNFEEIVENPTTRDATPVYNSVIRDLGKWPGSVWGVPFDRGDGRQFKRAEDGLKEIGWVFWEDRTRLEYFGLYDLDTGINCDFGNWLSRLRHQRCTWLGRFEAEGELPERFMFVTKEDHQELSAKYTAAPATNEREFSFLCRARSIRDEPSKEVSPAFREIVSGQFSSSTK